MIIVIINASNLKSILVGLRLILMVNSRTWRWMEMKVGEIREGGGLESLLTGG